MNMFSSAAPPLSPSSSSSSSLRPPSLLSSPLSATTLDPFPAAPGTAAGTTLGETAAAAVSSVSSMGTAALNAPYNAFQETQRAGLYESMTQWMSFDNTFSKIVFTVALVLALFLLLRVSLALVLFLWPAEDSPYLISGVLQGTTTVVVAQDPAKHSGKLIARSRDQDMGMEFTWSVWLFIDSAELPVRDGDKEYAVFNKGNPKTQNGPGLYVGREMQNDSSANVAYLKVRMDMHGTTEPKELKITKMPLQKWFHVALRLQNKELDVYINGTVTEHAILDNVPQQNYADVHVFPTELNSNNHERFTGFLADLVYFPYALNIYRLNAIVLGGPSSHFAAANTTSLVKGKDGDYMSPAWYAAQT